MYELLSQSMEMEYLCGFEKITTTSKGIRLLLSIGLLRFLIGTLEDEFPQYIPSNKRN